MCTGNWLIEYIVLYVTLNTISVTSWRQVKWLMHFLSFTVLGWASEMPWETPTKKTWWSTAAQTQDPLITSQTLYHWAMHDPTHCLRIRSSARWNYFFFFVQNLELNKYKFVINCDNKINFRSSLISLSNFTWISKFWNFGEPHLAPNIR